MKTKCCVIFFVLILSVSFVYAGTNEDFPNKECLWKCYNHRNPYVIDVLCYNDCVSNNGCIKKCQEDYPRSFLDRDECYSNCPQVNDCYWETKSFKVGEKIPEDWIPFSFEDGINKTSHTGVFHYDVIWARRKICEK